MNTIISASPDYAIAQFNLLVLIAAIAAMMALLIALIIGKHSLINSTIITAVIFIGFYAIGYNEINKFHQLTMTGNMLYLEYVRSSDNIYLIADEIQSITFGADGPRSNMHCFISINLHSGEKYQSVLLDDDFTVCKAYRSTLKKILTLN